MIVDRILGVFAILGLIAFVSVLIVRVPVVPLILVIVIALGMAIWDLWTTLRLPRNHSSSTDAK